MESCCPAMKLQCTSPFGLNKMLGFGSQRVTTFWGAEVVKANNLRTQTIRSGPQKIQTNLIRSVLTPFVDQESHVSICLVMLNLVISNLSLYALRPTLLSGF